MEQAIPYFQVVVENLTYIMSLIISRIINMMLIWFRGYAKKKWNLNVSDQQFNSITGLVLQGINYAEEKANTWAKEDEDDRPDSAHKLDLALEFVNAQARELGLDLMARDRLVELIEAQLPDSKFGAT